MQYTAYVHDLSQPFRVLNRNPVPMEAWTRTRVQYLIQTGVTT